MTRRRPSILLVVLLALASCDGCNGDGNGDTWDPAGIPELGQVEVVPRTVYAAPGTSFQLEARVTDPVGRIVDVRDYEQISIAWSAGTNLFPQNDENPVEVKVPNTPGAVISDVRATVRRVVNRPGGLEDSQVESDPATIRLAEAAPGGPATDRIVVEQVSGAPPAAVLLDARDEGGPDCLDDWTLAVAGTADLGRDLAGSCPSGAEIAIFAAGREMKFLDSSPWTVGGDEETHDPLSPKWFRSVQVQVGVDADTGNVEAWGKLQIQEAEELLDRNRAGIGVEWVGHFEHKRDLPITDAEAACGTASVNAMLGPAWDVTSDKLLFVLFVPEIGDEGKGWACQPEAGWAGRVVFISWNGFTPSTLAHELGHTLSLRDPHLNFANGHTNPLQGFTRANLMWSSSDFRTRSNRTHLSVGQVYRMNLHPASLLNLVLEPGLRVERSCQPDLSQGVCPALAQDLGEVGS